MRDPNNIIHGAASMSVDGVDVGWTQGGVSLRRSRDLLDIEADQVIGVIDKKVTMERVFLTTTMIEATVANMLMALDINGSGSGDGEFGESAPEATEHSITVTGKAPDGDLRTYTFYRCVINEEVEHMIGARDQIGMLPVVFEVMKDPAHGDTFGFFADS